ncbi:hypothetical protein [Millionella massiliensis]|uniref:hypothetical protein n=1 Tax=Millionella massiliensis TaxID=1871023 RepID=UPI0008D9720E|nr:hypothetical protein [Millionella massiliensis]
MYTHQDFQDDKAHFAELTQKEVETRCGWFRHILSVTITLLAILVPLQWMSELPPLVRYGLALSETLLSIGTLGVAIALYMYGAGLARKVRSAFLRELKEAHQSGRKMQHVSACLPDWFSTFEKWAYGFLIAGFVLLIATSVVSLVAF